MRLGLSLSLTAGGGGGSFGPQQILGSSLLGYWDAEKSVSRSGSAVTAWADQVAGYSVTQGIGTARPIWSATSFNGRPGVTFDGSDDELTLATSPFPINADPCEIWVLTDQAALIADTTFRTAVSYGAAGLSRRCISRGPGTGIVRAYAVTGDGASGVLAANSTVDFQGRHVVRAVIDGTQERPDVDAIAGSAAAVIPTTTSTRFRIGAVSNSTAAEFWQGTHSIILVTSLLTAPQVTQITNYLKARGGIA